MKRNRLFILGIVTVLVALLSLTLVSGTYAKYTSSATGSDTARVAKWSVVYNGGSDQELATSSAPTLTVDLFQSAAVYDLDGVADIDDLSEETGTVDADVKDGTSPETIVAPGTWGKLSFTLKNLSEVTAQYALDFSEEETNNGGNDIRIEYSLDGKTWGAINSIDVAASNSTVLAKESGTKVVEVYWRWTFGTTDAEHTADTALGILAQSASNKPTVEVTLAVTFTQVD